MRQPRAHLLVLLARDGHGGCDIYHGGRAATVGREWHLHAEAALELGGVHILRADGALPARGRLPAAGRLRGGDEQLQLVAQSALGGY